MFLRQIHDPHLAQYAYVIGCQKTGEAIVIDPLRDVEQYRSIAAGEGLRLTAVAETHIHADFVSGARVLGEEDKVKVYVSAEGGPDWQSKWAEGMDNVQTLRDGMEFMVGNIKFRVMHTPGHTPEHLCYLVTDVGGGADKPVALLSGDFLFVGDVGRPDLLEQAAGFSDTQEAGARELYHSLKKLEALPDYLQVLPAHGAGSACGKSLGAVPSSTLGYEKEFNHAFRLALRGTEKEFVEFILEGQPEPPLYFGNMKVVNRDGPDLRGEVSGIGRMGIADIIARLDDSGFVPLDTRSDPAAYAAGHLRGSIYAPAKGDFSGFAGSYLDPRDEVLLIVESPDRVENLERQLFRIGIDRTVGWISVAALAEFPDGEIVSVETIQFDGLEKVIDEHPGMTILDVRRAGEYNTGHLEGAVNIAHTRLRPRSGELPAEGVVIVHCQSGGRAVAGVSWLKRLGRDVIFVNDTFTNAPSGLVV